MFSSFQNVFGLFRGHFIYEVLFPAARSVNSTTTGQQILHSPRHYSHHRSNLDCGRELGVTPHR